VDPSEGKEVGDGKEDTDIVMRELEVGRGVIPK